MAGKRKSITTEPVAPRRSSRLKGPEQMVAADSSRTESTAAVSASSTTGKRTTKKTKVSAVEKEVQQERPAKKSKSIPEPTSNGKKPQSKKAGSNPATGRKVTNNDASSELPAASNGATADRQYWLMKAEPESRLENGTDVKFSIDDLKSKDEPEPWDGIRAYAARNNLRAMKKGDLAFFYHSNCKEPGIVGTMEIVEEHFPDLSAHDPKAPYYDPSSKPSDPKWSVVHVRFRSKFSEPITLKQLREMGGPGKPLENMQMLKQSRLSVSKVTPDEWDYLLNIASKQ